MDNEKRMEDVISRIKNRRSELMMSYKDLAQKTGLSKSTLQRYETGSIKNIPIDKLGILADALNVNPVWLMGYNVTKTLKSEPQNSELSKSEITLLEYYNKLNCLGKKEAHKRISELTEIERYTSDEITSTINNDITYDDFQLIAAHNDNLTESEIEEVDRRILNDLNTRLHR